MEKENWKYISMLNMIILTFLGMAIHEYFKNNHMDWYNSHMFLGTFTLLMGVAGWLVLVSQSTTYLHSKSRDNENVR